MSNSLFGLIIFALQVISCQQSKEHEQEADFYSIEEYTIINLYDAFGENNTGMEKDFGFSCILKYNGTTILFDAGTNAEIFKQNVEALNIDLAQVDFAIASHAHFDHINGFDYLLKKNPGVKIYFPFDMFWGANIPFNLSGRDSTIVDSLETRMQYFDGDFQNYQFNQTGRFWKANVEFVKENYEIAPGINLIVTSSPYMGYFNKYPGLENDKNGESIIDNIKLQQLNELSLSLKTNNGEVLVVGCSHSTVEQIIINTRNYTSNDISLVYGGYHLLPYDKPTLLGLANRLKDQHQVKRVAPAHCTGHLAFKILQDTYQKDYVFAGLGETVRF